MFLQSSRLIYQDVYLLSLGDTCRYACVNDDQTLSITDPGASLHIPVLQERLHRLGLSISSISSVFVTHLDADRVAGIALLRRLAPHLKVYGTAAMQQLLQSEDVVKQLWHEDSTYSQRLSGAHNESSIEWSEFRESLHIDRPLHESDSIELGEELSIRSVSTPGHRSHSMAYLLIPHEFLFVDETFGYFRGKELAAPGADDSLVQSLSSISRFDHIELSGIGFPYNGAITGQLVRKHLSGLVLNCADLEKEYRSAWAAGIPAEEIQTQVREAFYLSSSKDPFFTESFGKSFDSIMRQISAHV